MDLLLLSSVVMFGGLLVLFDVFDSGDGHDDSPEPEPSPHGTPDDDTLSVDHGMVSGWGGNDHLDLSGDAQGNGNQGNDTITAADHSSAYGGMGEDHLTAHDTSIIYGGGGHDIGYADGHATLHGEAGDDTFGARDFGSSYGDAGADMLDGYGNSTVYGGDGSDRVVAWDQSTAYGGDGADHVTVQNQGLGYGDAGNDLLSTTTGQNTLPLTSELYGGLGDDLIAGGSHLYGGAGNDWLAAGNSLFGGEGNDILSYGHGVMQGGAGDDLLYIGHEFDDGTASGGSGNDIFVVNPLRAGNDTEGMAVIDDFTKGQDQLAILVPSFEGYDLATESLSFAIEAHPDLGYTDVRVTLHMPPTSGANPIDYSGDSVIRLMGVPDFTAEDVIYVMNDGAAAPIGSLQDMQQALSSTPTADEISITHAYTGTAGNDTYTAAAPSALTSDAAWLGAGDDSFTASGQAHFVNAGAGNDHYIGAAPFANNPHAQTDPSTIVHMGDGNDLLDIGQGVGTFFGGAGNDTFHTAATPDAATNPNDGHNIQLYGGSGADSYVIGSGDTAIFGGGGTDDFTFDVSEASLAAGTNVIWGYQPGEHLRIEIPADIAGEVRFVDSQATTGSGLDGTYIYIGDRQIAYIEQFGSGAITGLRDGINNVEVVRT